MVAVGSGFGTLPAVATAILAFLIYDILFTEPRFSLVVAALPTTLLTLGISCRSEPPHAPPRTMRPALRVTLANSVRWRRGRICDGAPA
ncbi:MAG: hypothetical protein ACSLFN_00670 [Candidatus Limnocylindrales bacterium]